MAKVEFRGRIRPFTPTQVFKTDSAARVEDRSVVVERLGGRPGGVSTYLR